MLNMQAVSIVKAMTSIIKSIDLYNYLLKNHHRRCAIIAYHLGNEYNHPEVNLSELVLAASLHDIGALNVKERDQLLEMDVLDPSPHEVLGAKMLEGFEPFDQVRKIVRHHHIHYSDVVDGIVSSEEVPFECYILHLADRIEILSGGEDLEETKHRIIDEITIRFGTVFHPALQESFMKCVEGNYLWHNLKNQSYQELLYGSIRGKTYDMSYVDAENLALVFAKIVDLKSPWTSTHSQSVSAIAYKLGKLVGLDAETCFQLRLAGYLHDIGKIATPTEVLNKPGALTNEEFDTIKEHAIFTSLILKDIEGMDEVVTWASSHHEKRDHSGYPLHISEEYFTLPMDILAFADIFTALSEDRPYRPQMSKQEIKDILKTFSPTKLDAKVYQVLMDNFDELYELHHKVFLSLHSDKTKSV